MKNRLESIDSKLQQVVEAELEMLDKMQKTLQASGLILVVFTTAFLLTYLINWSY